jgi:hypothetical protein
MVMRGGLVENIKDKQSNQISNSNDSYVKCSGTYPILILILVTLGVGVEHPYQWHGAVATAMNEDLQTYCNNSD